MCTQIKEKSKIDYEIISTSYAISRTIHIILYIGLYISVPSSKPVTICMCKSKHLWISHSLTRLTSLTPSKYYCLYCDFPCMIQACIIYIPSIELAFIDSVSVGEVLPRAPWLSTDQCNICTPIVPVPARADLFKLSPLCSLYYQ